MAITITGEVLFKLGLAAILGMIIGLERELRNKPLGLKTSLVISLSSCLLTIVSITAAHKYAQTGIYVMDPMRLAAQIVSGIGFLGAGVILRKSNDVILGLTTAAMIWAASGLGIAVGAGFYVEATAVLLLILLSVEFIPMIIRWAGPSALKRREMQLRLTIKGNHSMNEVISAIEGLNMKIGQMKISDQADGTINMEMIITVHHKRNMTDLYYDLRNIPAIERVEAEMLNQ